MTHPYRSPSEMPIEPAPAKPRVPLLCRLGVHFWQPFYRVPAFPGADAQEASLLQRDTILLAGLAGCSRCPKEKLVEIVRVPLSRVLQTAHGPWPLEEPLSPAQIYLLETQRLTQLEALQEKTRITLKELDAHLRKWFPQ